MQDAQLVKAVGRSPLGVGSMKVARFGSWVFAPQRIHSTLKVLLNPNPSCSPAKSGRAVLKSAGSTQNGETENQNLTRAGATDRDEAEGENVAQKKCVTPQKPQGSSGCEGGIIRTLTWDSRHELQRS